MNNVSRNHDIRPGIISQIGKFHPSVMREKKVFIIENNNFRIKQGKLPYIIKKFLTSIKT